MGQVAAVGYVRNTGLHSETLDDIKYTSIKSDEVSMQVLNFHNYKEFVTFPGYV